MNAELKKALDLLKKKADERDILFLSIIMNLHNQKKPDVISEKNFEDATKENTAALALIEKALTTDKTLEARNAIVKEL